MTPPRRTPRTNTPRTLAAGAAGLASLTLVAPLAPTPAHAAGYEVMVASATCNTITVTNTSSRPGSQNTRTDNLAVDVELYPGQSRTVTVPAGRYTWQTRDYESYQLVDQSTVQVAPCSAASPRRPLAGDQDGDGLSDLLAIDALTGNLEAHRTTTAGVGAGTRIGWGWGSTVFLQQVTELDGPAPTRHLIAVHDDGTVWRYDNPTAGRFTHARKIGEGFRGFSNFAVLPGNNDLWFGNPVLVASDGTSLRGYLLNPTSVTMIPTTISASWSSIHRTMGVRTAAGGPMASLLSVDGAGVLRQQPVMAADPEPPADPAQPRPAVPAPVVVGSGWAGAQVTSHASLDGDQLPDLLLKRPDGTLQRYSNRGGSWGNPVLVGRGWRWVRLVA